MIKKELQQNPDAYVADDMHGRKGLSHLFFMTFDQRGTKLM